MASSRPEETIRFPIAVDSPPGTIIPARPSRSSMVRTSTGSTPKALRISACSRKSPWSARTPIFFWPLSPLPSTGSEPLSLREVAHLPAHHRLAEALARLGDDLRIPKVGRGPYYGHRALLRVAALEDPAPDEDPVGPELHHQRRVGGGCDPSRGKEHHRQLPVLSDPAHQVVGRPEGLGLGHQLLRAKGGKASDPADYRAHVADGLDDVAGPGFAFGADHGSPLAD